MEHLSDPRFWLHLVQWLVMIALGVSVWLRKPGEEAARAVTDLRQSVQDEQRAVLARMATFEERLRHMPTSEELTQLEGTVKAIDARIGALTDSMSTVRTQLGRIEQWLLHNGSTR